MPPTDILDYNYLYRAATVQQCCVMLSLPTDAKSIHYYAAKHVLG